MSASARLYLAIGMGSMLGSLLRALVSLGLLQLLGPGFPWGTLAVNVLGSFLIGLYAALVEPGGRVRASLVQSQFVLAGFCGGFTTFSFFSLESLLLYSHGAYGLAALYLAVSVLLWLLAVWTGHRMGRGINRRRR